MSILIKGMSMPTGCDRCILRGVGFGGWVCVPTKRLAAEEAYEPKPFKERPDWCPLVELPPHGRLIDADALHIDLIDRGIADIQTNDMYEIRQAIDDAPTIIESEVEDA